MAMRTYTDIQRRWLTDSIGYLELIEAHKRAKKPTTKPEKEEASDEAIDFPELDNQ